MSNKKKPSLGVFLNQINNIRELNSNGEYIFPAWRQDEIVATLATLAKVKEKYPDMEHEQLILEALQVTELSSDNFIASLKKQKDAYTKNHFREYALVTSVSALNARLPQIKEGDVRITFHKKLPARYQNRKEKVSKDYPLYMLLKVKARSVHEAQNKAIAIAEQQRALWAIHIQPTRVINFGSYSIDSLVQIKYHDFTVHQEDSISVYKSNKNHFTPTLSKLLSEEVLRSCKNFKTRLKKCGYREDINTVLGLYLSALDESDPARSFIVMWAALEALTTPGQADYNVLIQRCLFAYKNGEGQLEVLEHLRQNRNDLAHRAIAIDDTHVLTYQTQDYVRGLLAFHMKYAGKFQTLQDANRLLDLPPELSLLNQAVAYLKMP